MKTFKRKMWAVVDEKSEIVFDACEGHWHQSTRHYSCFSAPILTISERDAEEIYCPDEGETIQEVEVTVKAVKK